MNEKQERVRHRFNAFCKRVIRYEAINCWKENSRRREHEISLFSLLDKELDIFSTAERYPALIYHFQVQEWQIEVRNERLGNAIEHLTPYRQEIILLHYFVGFREKELAERYGCRRGKISYHKLEALKQIRKELGDVWNE